MTELDCVLECFHPNSLSQLQYKKLKSENEDESIVDFPKLYVRAILNPKNKTYKVYSSANGNLLAGGHLWVFPTTIFQILIQHILEFENSMA